MRPSSLVRCGVGQGSISLGLSFPTWEESALPGLCDLRNGGRGPPILRVTWRAHSAYLRPSDLSCRFLLAADPGRALARLFPGLPEGGAGAVWGGAGRGRDPGPRFRGDRGARTQTATHSGAAVPGEQTQGPRVRPPLSSTFCLAPPSGKAPRGWRELGLPFPLRTGVWTRAEAGSQSAGDMVLSNFSRAGTFGLVSKFPPPWGPQRRLTPSRASGSLSMSPSLCTPPPPFPQGCAVVQG